MTRTPPGPTVTPPGPTTYTTLAAPAEALIEIKRSRFLARLEPVEDEEGARACIDAARRAHHDARHHCSAFILGADRRTERSSDDGEPSGTAGAPMLDVLRGSGLTDVVAVVTRWFGGTKLGTGGLARAYAEAVTAALAQARSRQRALLLQAHLEVDIAAAGRVEHELRARGLTVTGVDYGQRARLGLALPPADEEQVRHLVADVTSGAGELVTGSARWVDAG